jgi:hypothetical protein
MSAPPGHPKCTKNCGKIHTKIHIGEIIGLPPPPLTWHTNGVGEWKNLVLKIKIFTRLNYGWPPPGWRSGSVSVGASRLAPPPTSREPPASMTPRRRPPVLLGPPAVASSLVLRHQERVHHRPFR